jgi:hypothetical protein
MDERETVPFPGSSSYLPLVGKSAPQSKFYAVCPSRLQISRGDVDAVDEVYGFSCKL